jgi:hypothetical protein
MFYMSLAKMKKGIISNMFSVFYHLGCDVGVFFFDKKTVAAWLGNHSSYKRACQRGCG